jgi:hypothetical protein
MHGIFDQDENLQQFPANIRAEGKTWPRPTWGEQADSRYGLSGETWWEVDHRRNQYTDLLDRINSGKISSSDEAVTSNLDLLTIAIDAIDEIDSPKDAVKAWDILEQLRVIDPTCGSGAFLFAALRILEDLYAAVLDSLKKHGPTSKDKRLTALIARVASHSSDEYFISKNAILRNLYGVDLMSEAIEIARLRLFLRLVSHVRTRDQLEPLPDLDFNLKHGNALVGALNTDSVDAEQGDLFSESAATEAKDAASKAAVLYREFQNAIENADESLTRSLKTDLHKKLVSLRKKVDKVYFKGLVSGTRSIDEWREQSQPFHWFLEFPEVMTRGGFDVVVGNPPYVNNSKIDYDYEGFKTDSCPDIFAPCTERAISIVNRAGRFAMILPISSQFGSDFKILRDVMRQGLPAIWMSTFSRNPAALFSAGLGVRSTIAIGSRSSLAKIHTTKTCRWYEEFRPHVFATLAYSESSSELADLEWARFPSAGSRELFTKMRGASGHGLAKTMTPNGAYAIGFKTIALYWLSAFIEAPPCFTREGRKSPQTKIGTVRFVTAEDQWIALAVVNSKIGFCWWGNSGDDFDLTQKMVGSIPIDLSLLARETRNELIKLGKKLDIQMKKHIQYTPYAGKWMGNYVIPECRGITDEVDKILISSFSLESLRAELELNYWTLYKPTGERPGVVRTINFTVRVKKKK